MCVVSLLLKVSTGCLVQWLKEYVPFSSKKSSRKISHFSFSVDCVTEGGGEFIVKEHRNLSFRVSFQMYWVLFHSQPDIVDMLADVFVDSGNYFVLPCLTRQQPMTVLSQPPHFQSKWKMLLSMWGELWHFKSYFWERGFTTTCVAVLISSVLFTHTALIGWLCHQWAQH